MNAKSATAHRILLAVACMLALALSCLFASTAFASAPEKQLTVNAEAAAQTDTSLSTAASGPSVNYAVKLSGTDWQRTAANYAVAGKTADPYYVTSIKFSLDSEIKGTIWYRALPWYGSWSAWKKNGKAITSNSGFEAVEIMLTGAIADQYDVVYRVNLHDIGWQRRMHNGENAGVTSQQGASWIRGLRVKLVPKSMFSGWGGSGNSWGYYKNGTYLTNCWVTTNESPINDKLGTATGKKKYWLDAGGYLALDRVIDPSTYTDAAAKHPYYVTANGYAERGAHQTSAGIVISTSKGRIYTKARWLTTKNAAGKTVRYRLKKNGSYAVACTGLFKVNGKKYYAWPDSGELLRSKSWWISGNWYTANSKGVLKKTNNQKIKHIERYVKWALKIAKDDSHGYSQITRWGPDYDCSSFVLSAVKAAGFSIGAAIYTGNMQSELTQYGFRWYTDFSKLRRGDIAVAHNSWSQHTEMYIGNSQLVGASQSETGGIDGQTGDQTGSEIRICNYYSMPWDGFLRYVGK